MPKTIVRQQIEQILSASPAVTYVCKAYGDFGAIFVSENITTLFGYSVSDCLGNPSFWRENIHPEDVERALLGIDQLFIHGSLCHEYRFRTKEGKYKWVHDELRLLFDADGKPSEFVGTWLDITNQKKAHLQLAEKQNFLQTIIDNVVDPMMVVSLDRKIMLINKNAQKYLAHPHSDCEGLICEDVCPALNKPCQGVSGSCPALDVKKTGEAVKVLQKIQTRTDGVQLYETIASPYRNEQGEMVGVINLSRNITEQAEMLTQITEQEKKLQFLAYHDHLTHLPNRLHFQDHMKQALSRAQREGSKCALMFFDLDRFKVINDSLGHDIGDLALKKVAEILAQNIRDMDFVARFGGDEFMVLLEGVQDIGQVSPVARKLLKQIEHPIKVRGLDLFLTASIGISLFPDDAVDGEGLVKNAEIAMGRGRGNGHNTYTFYDGTMDCMAHDQFEQESMLRKSLERGEMELFYQPQIELMTKKIIGFEGLIRWNHPEKGLVGPDQFIPLAEETGLIVPLGEWCIDQACQFIQKLEQSGLSGLHVAVNISPRHFRQDSLVNCVTKALSKTGAAPECLELEITEGTVMEDVTNAIEKMERINSLGVSLAIDDFGTEYSSLKYLQKFPIKKLKIDRSFVGDIQGGGGRYPLVKTIITLAEEMNLVSVAEGVEHQYQLDALSGMGCSLAQGYLLSKALPEKEALAFLDTFESNPARFIQADI